MIIIKLLGGLGNQMFQYAVAKVIADKHNVPVKMDLRGLYAGEDIRTKYELHIFGIPEQQAKRNEYFPFFRKTLFGSKWLWDSVKKVRKLKRYKEESFRYAPKLIEESTPNMYISGLFQSEKYFAHKRDMILRLYRFPEFTEKLNIELAEFIKQDNSVAIHIRRGEFANDPKYRELIGTQNLDYYYRAIDYIAKQVKAPVFYIFSDDPTWAKENLSLQYPYKIIDWNTGNRHWRDMQLMSLCKHNIIANSTFSWWAAWLNQNPNKIVIAPRRWFGKWAERYDTTDLIPENWIKL